MTATTDAFTFEIHFPDGESNGYRIITNRKWPGECVVCPRILFREKKEEPAFQRRGVYVLIGDSDEMDKEKIYIGATHSVINRLNTHDADPNKDFWKKVIFFVSTSEDGLNGDNVEYLEAHLITIAKEAKRCDLVNEQFPQSRPPSQNDAPFVNYFLRNMLRCFSAIGIGYFDKPKIRTNEQNTKFLYLKEKGIEAKGYEGEDGIVVCAGSQAVIEETPSFQTRPNFQRARNSRAFLIDQGILKPENGIYIFTQDYTLGSPANASNVVLATPYNGLDCWKDAHGKSLKEIRKRESESAN